MLNWTPFFEKRLHILEQALFQVLWLVWFLLLPGSSIVKLATGNHHLFSFFWTSSIVLCAVAWINYSQHRRDEFRRFAFLTAMGMTAGMLADLYGNALTEYSDLHPLSVIAPLFALGHVSYIAGVLSVVRRMQSNRQLPWGNVFAATIGLFGLLGFVLWKTLVHSSEYCTFMHLPLAVYTALLATAAGAMLTAAIFSRHFVWMAIGGFLFLASDGFLAVKLFQDNAFHLGDLCWITYGIGQMMIVYGAAIACRQPR